MKKIKIPIALIALLLTVALSACGADVKNNNTVTSQTNTVTETIPEKTTQNTYEISSGLNESDIIHSEAEESETTAAITENSSAANPAEWTKAEIIDIYKKAAEKSDNKVKSEQTINMKDISINNGQYQGVIDFVMPIMSKLLANNSTEKDGITGGYKNLTETDVNSAKAYAVGDKIAIEMTMNNQTDKAKSDPLSGTVGHAITTVGDISEVTKQLNDLGLPIHLSDKDTSIHYTNAKIKVLIDKDGNIVKGTWSYTVDIRLNNYKVGNSTVDTTSVVMDNIITINGGF